MGQAHAHSHAGFEGDGNYYLDQLFTILVCGGIGLVAVLMYLTGMLGRMLVPMFFVPVLLGGVAVLAFAAIRTAAVWQRAHPTAQNAASVSCGHDHAHSHGGEHGWAPWRYMVMAIPVFLYFLDLPRAGGLSIPKQEGTVELEYSPERQSLAALSGGTALTSALRKTEPQRLNLRFYELAEAAAVPSRRETLEGNVGIIRGRYMPFATSDRDFTLFRWKRTCCDADAVPMRARIEAPEPIQGITVKQWVQVEGVISFRTDGGRKWVPVISLKSNDDITPTAQPTNDGDGF